MDVTSLNLMKVAFMGPYVPEPQSGRRIRHLYPSISHWYESNKFMPLRPDLRDSVLFCPTIKEARKFSQANQKHWRSDWNLIRHHVLIAGLGFLAIDRPDLALGNQPKVLLAHQFTESKLPERFIDACLDRFLVWAGGPCIGTFGSNTAPNGVVGKKMAKVTQPKPAWTLVSFCNKKTGWKLHDWALSQYVPTKYIGHPESRNTGRLLEEFISASDQIVIFEARGGKANDAAIQKTKQMKKPCSLELYRPEEYTSDEID